MRKTTKSFPAKATAFLAVVLPAVAIVGQSMAAPPVQSIGQAPSIDALKRQFGGELLLVAPLSTVHSGGAALDVLGQTVTLGPKAVTNASLRPGQMVAVTGSVQPDGSILATSVVDLPDAYVDGATEILGSGVITSHNASTARLTIGRLPVDYSPTLYAGDPGLTVGSTVEFRGIRVGSAGNTIAFSISVLSHATGSMGSGPEPMEPVA